MPPKIEIANGTQFGKWTVIECVGKNKHGSYSYKVQCTCEDFSIVAIADLRSKSSTACVRCATSKYVMKEGSKFGNWTVIKYAGTHNQNAVYECRCACGTIKNVYRSNLARTKSCKKCINIQLIEYDKKIYRISKHPLYDVVANINDRISNQRNWQYHNYGGRGLKMDPQFFKEEGNLDYHKTLTLIVNKIGPRPNAKMSLDRIDNDRGYYLDNLQWATVFQQAQNRRTSNKNKDKWVYIAVPKELEGQIRGIIKQNDKGIK